ncbi:3-hydroxybutyrate dehydrogenase type 2 [Geodia barretti]|uniref:Dehydrogenase/reductase SDR family member 6 n=1 Tax=Geodia barretti TaxID=519541 RepID=A0AA35SLN8_GEOBA|nr:3-hydroxybutyrate dehydrogenase type 2 [Geodia barretti]
MLGRALRQQEAHDMSDTVQIERENGIARVTLNRPEVLNALDAELCEALLAALAALERDSETRVLVLRGAGGHFMAGGDLRSFYELIKLTPDERRQHFEGFIDVVHRIIRIMRRMPQPVIASIAGATGGFGLSLVLAADLAVCAADSIFTMAYCRIGTSPDGSSTWFLPRTVGAKKAMELALLGDRFGAREAERLGIVNRVVSPHRLEEETRRWPAGLPRAPPAPTPTPSGCSAIRAMPPSNSSSRRRAKSGQGIGHATAVAFHNEGAELWATDIDEAKLAGLATLEGVTCRALDVRDAGAVAAAADEIGALDVLFNCAGRVPHGALLDCEPEDWEETLSLNVTAMYRMIRAFLPAMLAQGGGSIINMASVVSSVKAAPDRCAYGASKAAVIGLTKRHARTCSRATKWGRMASPSEIAALCAYLGSDESAFVTGQALVIDGAWGL